MSYTIQCNICKEKGVVEDITNFKCKFCNDKKLTKLEKVAILLHDRNCHHNHTDGCGWQYAVRNGIHDWNEFAHKEYLKKAQEIIELVENTTGA